MSDLYLNLCASCVLAVLCCKKQPKEMDTVLTRDGGNLFTSVEVTRKDLSKSYKWNYKEITSILHQ